MTDEATTSKNAVSAVTIVSGLPRSGTSLMMQMLEAGGLPALTDGIRAADASNPRGYYELEAVKNTAADPSWLSGAAGRAVKMVSMLLYDLPSGREYNVIFMQRDLDEVIRSQEAMLERLGRERGPEPGEMKRHYVAHLDRLERWLGRRADMRVLRVNFNEIMAEPGRHAERVREFLGVPLNVRAMCSVVDAGLYRERKA